MSTASIQIPEAVFQKLEKELQAMGKGKNVKTALARAVNRALTQGRTELSRAIREQYTVKYGKIKNAIRIEKMTPQNGEGKITVSGPNLPASYFQHKPTGDTTGKKRRLVSVRAKKSGSFMPIRAGFNFNKTIFERAGAKRLPIQRVLRVSVAGMAQNAEVTPRVEKKIQEVAVKRIEYELEKLQK